jgi:hypothetical protein
MASTSESGHNKNVANFSSAIQILEEMGTLYNPSNANLLLASLNPIKTNLSAVITELNNKKPIYKNAVAERELEIAPLGKLSTRTLNFAKSIAISSADKENLESQAKKIRGDAKAKAVNPDTAEVETISTSQMSYDSRIANLDTYISQLESHQQYVPNETELQITSLRTYHQQLETLSSTVNTAGNALITARKNRNKILYTNSNNVIQIIKDIKAYLKSLDAEGAPYYKALVKLKFKDLPK